LKTIFLSELTKEFKKNLPL